MKNYLVFIFSLLVALIVLNFILKALKASKLPVLSQAADKAHDLALD